MQDLGFECFSETLASRIYFEELGKPGHRDKFKTAAGERKDHAEVPGGLPAVRSDG